MRFVQLIPVAMLLSAGAVAQQTNAPAPVFPLARGTYWIYEGDVTYNLTPNQVTTATVRRRMQVEDVVTGADFRAGFVKGGPWDLEFYTNGKAAGDYLIVSTNEAAYFAEGQQARDVFRQLKQGGLTHEIRDTLADNIWFRIPLRTNGMYCPPQQIAREDRMYCWSVTDVKSQRVAANPAAKAGARTVYELTLRTNPDTQTVEIAPGVGIVHFTYSHHGTPSAADVKLVDFHAGK